MRENRSSGSVEGVVSNHDPYSDCAEGRFVGPIKLQEQPSKSCKFSYGSRQKPDHSACPRIRSASIVNTEGRFAPLGSTTVSKIALICLPLSTRIPGIVD